MSSIDERIVSMKFNNSQFEAGIRTTLSSLDGLKKSLNFDASVKSLNGLDTAGRKMDIKFDNRAFDAGVQSTVASANELKQNLKFDGAVKSLHDLDNAGKKISLKLDATAFQNGARGVIDAANAIKTNLTFESVQRNFANLKTSAQNMSFQSVSTGVQSAISSLGSLDMAAKNVRLDSLASQVDGISSKFSGMSAVGVGALMAIGAKAAIVGPQIAAQLLIDPAKSGLAEYETNLGSIQTIMANTQHEGTNLGDVNGALDELNAYSDKTIYNFAEMAKNIGTFTSAGVKLDDSTNAIKGIANLAALSGSNSEQASGAMYQLSQAMSAGKVGLEDWNSVVNSGMGGKVFQDALIETAKNQGKNVDGLIAKHGSFRQSLQEGWITTEVMTETLSKMTGDLTDEQLASMGYNAEQIKGIQAMAKTAGDAATKIKTFTQLTGTLTEITGSGWAQSWKLILGDFEQAKEMWTNVYKTIGTMVQGAADARNKLLGDWNAAGGRTEMIWAVTAAFKVLMGVITPIKEAFREVFPPMTGQQLYKITQAVRLLIEALIPGAVTTALLKNSFKLLFTIIKIGLSIIQGALSVVFAFFKAFATGGESISGSMQPLTDFLAKITNDLANSTFVADFFANLAKGAVILGTALGKVVPYVVMAATAIYDLGYTLSGYAMYFVSRFARILAGEFMQAIAGAIGIIGNIIQVIVIFINSLDEGMAVAMTRVRERVESLQRAGDAIANAWQAAGEVIGRIWEKMLPLREAIAKMFNDIKAEITNALSDVNFDDTIDVVNLGLLGGLVLLFKNFFKRMLGMGDGLSEGIMGHIDTTFESINGVLESLTGTLGAMQQNLQAGTLMKIAIAVGILAISVIALSLVDSAKLTKGLIAIGVMVVILGKAMEMLDQISVGSGFLKIPFIAASMILLSVAILILSASVKILGDLKWGELIKGLLGVSVMLIVMAKAAEIMSRNPANLIAMGVGLIAVAIAIKILASAVKDLSEIGFMAMIQGLLGVGALLVALNIFNNMTEVNKGSLATMAGFILLAIALKIMASAVSDFAAMSVGELIQGLIVLGLVLTLLSKFTNQVTGAENMIKTAAAMLVLGFALKVIASAMGDFADLSWEDIAKGLLTMSFALRAITTSMSRLPPTILANAVGMVAIGIALKIMASALSDMGNLSWEQILKSLIVLTVTMSMLAVSLRLMQGSLAGAAAVFVVAAALALLTPALIALGDLTWEQLLHGLAALAAIFVIFGLAGLVLMPVVPVLAALGAAMFSMGTGLMLTGLGTVLFAAGLLAIGTAVMAVGPQLIIFVGTILALIPLAMIELGKGIVAFAEVIGNAAPIFLDAAVKLITTLLTGINIVMPQILDTLWNLIVGLVDLLVRAIPMFVDAGMKIIIGILTGIGNNMGQLVDAASKVITEFLNGISRNLPQITESGMNLIITFIESMATSVRNNSERMANAGADLAGAIIDGMANGVAQMAGRVLGAIGRVAEDALAKAGEVLNINSPSKEFIKIGKSIDEGWAMGIDKNGKMVTAATAGVGYAAMSILKKSLSGMSDAAPQDMNLSPTIRPVLDLSAVKKDSALVNGMLGTPTLDVQPSYNKATTISAKVRANREAMVTSEATASAAQSGDQVTYIQNITSPKAVSQGELYRQTKNQLSRTKGALVNA